MAVDVRVDAHFHGSCPIRRRLFFVILDQVPIKAFDMSVAIKGSMLFMRINQFPVNRFLLSRKTIEAMNEPLARSAGKRPMEDPGWEQSHAELCSGHSLDWPRDVSEVEACGLRPIPSSVVRPPRLEAAPICLECVLLEALEPDALTTTIIFGRVVRYHIDDTVTGPSGLVDATTLQPLCRLGAGLYAPLGAPFSLDRPRIDRATGEEPRTQ